MSQIERRVGEGNIDASFLVPQEASLIREINDFSKIKQHIEAEGHFNNTIFPDFLKRFSLQNNTRVNSLLHFNYWPQIGKRSAVADLIWNISFIENVESYDGYTDVYSGLALAIEVNPAGDLLFYSDEDPSDSGLFLPQLSWAGDSNIQKSYFDKAMINSKIITYVEQLSSQGVHD